MFKFLIGVVVTGLALLWIAGVVGATVKGDSLSLHVDKTRARALVRDGGVKL